MCHLFSYVPVNTIGHVCIMPCTPHPHRAVPAPDAELNNQGVDAATHDDDLALEALKFGLSIAEYNKMFGK